MHPAGGSREGDNAGALGLWPALPGWLLALLWLPFPLCVVWLVASEDEEQRVAGSLELAEGV